VISDRVVFNWTSLIAYEPIHISVKYFEWGVKNNGASSEIYTEKKIFVIITVWQNNYG